MLLVRHSLISMDDKLPPSPCSSRASNSSHHLYSYDSYDATKNQFVLSDDSLDECINQLECKTRDGGLTGKMCASQFTKGGSKMSTAAYKLMKVKRWQLLDENFVFDPLLFQHESISVPSKHVLWKDVLSEHPPAEDYHVMVQEMSVDAILSRLFAVDEKLLSNICKLEAAMNFLDIQGQVNVGGVRKDCIEAELRKGEKDLPDVMKVDYLEFVDLMTSIITSGLNKKKIPELRYQECFTYLFRCVAAGTGENFSCKCRSYIYDVVPKDISFHSKKQQRSVLLTAKPDLVIFSRSKSTDPVRVIAVLEAKGKFEDEIVDSDDEDTPEVIAQQETQKSRQHSFTCSHTIREEEKNGDHDDEDYGDCGEGKAGEAENPFKDIKHPKIERISDPAKKILRRFLPQLLGEMFVHSTARERGLMPLNVNCPGYSLGIGLLGFDVYFVTMIGLDHYKSFTDGLCTEGDYNNVFVTRPLSILARNDRKIIIKTLASVTAVHRFIM